MFQYLNLKDINALIIVYTKYNKYIVFVYLCIWHVYISWKKKWVIRINSVICYIVNVTNAESFIHIILSLKQLK